MWKVNGVIQLFAPQDLGMERPCSIERIYEKLGSEEKPEGA